MGKKIRFAKLINYAFSESILQVGSEGTAKGQRRILSAEGHPLYLKLSHLRGFTKDEISVSIYGTHHANDFRRFQLHTMVDRLTYINNILSLSRRAC